VSHASMIPGQKKLRPMHSEPFSDRLSPALRRPAVACRASCFRAKDDPGRFVILEIWDSIESHKAAVKDIPPEMFVTVMELLDGRPSGEYFRE